MEEPLPDPAVSRKGTCTGVKTVPSEIEQLYAAIQLEGGPSFFPHQSSTSSDGDGGDGDSLSCVICNYAASNSSELCKMAAKWPIFWLSPLDVEATREVGGKHSRSTSASGMLDDVPRSVGVVFPRLSGHSFRALLGKDGDGQWLQTPVLVCDACVERCGRANEYMSSSRSFAPAWMRLDETFATGAAKAAAKELEKGSCGCASDPFDDQPSCDNSAPTRLGVVHHYRPHWKQQ